MDKVKTIKISDIKNHPNTSLSAKDYIDIEEPDMDAVEEEYQQDIQQAGEALERMDEDGQEALDRMYEDGLHELE